MIVVFLAWWPTLLAVSIPGKTGKRYVSFDDPTRLGASVLPFMEAVMSS